MIGKSNWFTVRKYGGWGMFPKTWQGYVYCLVLGIMILIPFSIDAFSKQTQIVASFMIWIIFLIDLVDIMLKSKLDEREISHENKAEKNASWTMEIFLIASFVYIMYKYSYTRILNLEAIVIILGSLLLGLIAKVVTHYRIEK